MHSARFPVAGPIGELSVSERERLSAQFEDLEARHRLYVSEEEIAALIRSGVQCKFGFGVGTAWLVTEPDRRSFDALIQIRTEAALAKAAS